MEASKQIMTPSLLDHELVLKYFRDNCAACKDLPYQSLAWHVLDAMQHPLHERERYLSVWHDWSVHEESGLGSSGKRFVIRLPDKYQTPENKEHVCDCEFCGHPNTIHIPATKKECDHIGGGFVVSNTSVIRCMRCTQVVFPVPEPAPDKAVEDKILEIRDLYAKEKLDDLGPVVATIHRKLVELVELARRQK